MRLEVSGLKKRFGTEGVLRGVELSLDGGECIVMTGANGAGKSTLLRIIAGVCEPSAGVVRVVGRDPLDDPKARAAIGYMGHQPSLYPWLTGRENLAFFAGLRGAQPQISLAFRLGCGDYLDRPVAELSAGMRKRVGLVRALSGEPSLLLLDEPESSLDEEGFATLKALLSERLGEGAAVLLSSHTPDRFSGETVTLCEGLLG